MFSNLNLTHHQPKSDESNHEHKGNVSIPDFRAAMKNYQFFKKEKQKYVTDHFSHPQFWGDPSGEVAAQEHSLAAELAQCFGLLSAGCSSDHWGHGTRAGASANRELCKHSSPQDSVYLNKDSEKCWDSRALRTTSKETAHRVAVEKEKR